MRVTEIRNFSRKLIQARGNRAELEAARNASAMEHQGERDRALVWRRVQNAIKEMRGPHHS